MASAVASCALKRREPVLLGQHLEGALATAVPRHGPVDPQRVGDVLRQVEADAVAFNLGGEDGEVQLALNAT